MCLVVLLCQRLRIRVHHLLAHLKLQANQIQASRSQVHRRQRIAFAQMRVPLARLSNQHNGPLGMHSHIYRHRQNLR